MAAPHKMVANSEAGSNQSNHLNSCKHGATGVAPPCNGSEATAVAFTFAAYPPWKDCVGSGPKLACPFECLVTFWTRGHPAGKL